MLTDGIVAAYRAGLDRIAASTGVRSVLSTSCDLRNATPYLFVTTGADWLANAELGEEVFDLLGMVVIVKDLQEVQQVARA